MSIMFSQSGSGLPTPSLPALVYLLFASYCLDTFSATVLLRSILYLITTTIVLLILTPAIPSLYLEEFLSSFVPVTLLRALSPYLSRARSTTRAHLKSKCCRIHRRCSSTKRSLSTFGASLRTELAGLLRAMADWLAPPPDHDIPDRRLEANLQAHIIMIMARDCTIAALNRLVEDTKGLVRDLKADLKEERRATKASKRETEIKHLGQVLLLETQATIEKGNHESEIERKDAKLNRRQERLNAATALASDQQTQLLDQYFQLSRQASRLRAQEAQIQQQETSLEKYRTLDDDLETKTWELASCRTEVEILTSKVAELEPANTTLTSDVFRLEIANSRLTSRVARLERTQASTTQLAETRGAALEAARLESNGMARQVRFLEASVRSKLRVNSLLSGKYQALLAATVSTSAIFKAEFEAHDRQIASLKTDLKVAVDRCHVLDRALDMAIAGEYEARCLVEALDHDLRQRASAERRVLRRFGIGMASDAEEVEESFELAEGVASEEEEEVHRAEDDDLEGEDNAPEMKDCVEVAAEVVVSPESSECEAPVAGNINSEVEAPTNVPADVHVDGEVDVTAEATAENGHVSPQAADPSTPQVAATIADHAEDQAGSCDPDNFEPSEAAPDPPRARVLHTPLWSRRPLGIRRPEWVDTLLVGGEQEVRDSTTLSPEAECLESGVLVGQDEIVPAANTAVTIADGAEVEVDGEVIPTTNDSEIHEWAPLGPSDSMVEETTVDPPRARVLRTSLRSRRPLNIRRPEWDDQWWYGGRFSEPFQTYPRGILNVNGGRRALQVTWFKEEHLYFARESKPKVVVHSTSEDHHIP